MKSVILLSCSFLFAYGATSPLHGKGHAKHHSRRSQVSEALVGYVTETGILTQTAYFTASQEELKLMLTPPDTLDSPIITEAQRRNHYLKQNHHIKFPYNATWRANF